MLLEQGHTVVGIDQSQGMLSRAFVFPEDWPLVLSNLYRALKPPAYLYVTVEMADETEIEQAFTDGQKLGLAVVYGEWAMCARQWAG